MIHPSKTASIPANLFAISDDKIGFMPIESEDDYIYSDNKLKKVLSYKVDGKTVKDYEGFTNSDFTPSKMGDIRYNLRLRTQHKNDYIFTIWIDEEASSGYYSLWITRLLLGAK